MKPSPYQFFRIGHSGNTFTILQVRDITSGLPLDALNLTCYVVVSPIDTPYWRVTVCKGSRMILADDAAAPLLASGRIKPVACETLIPYREGADARKRDRAEAKRSEKISRKASVLD